MKIALVQDVIYPYRKGGGQKWFYEIAKRLAKRGHNVHMFGLRWWNGPTKLVTEGVTYHGVANPIAVHTSGRRAIFPEIYFSMAVAPKVLLEPDIDVINSCQVPYTSCLAMRLLSPIKGSQSVFWWYEILGKFWPRYLGKLGILGEMTERLVVKVGRYHVASSQYIKQRLMELGVSAKQICVVAPGVDPDRIANVKPTRCRSDVIYVGRLMNTKHLEVLIRAIVILKQRFNQRIRLAIVGWGPERARLEVLVNETGLKQNVTFLGALPEDDDVYSAMKASKVLVYPSAPEGGWAMSLIEASACGIPVVAARESEYGSCDENVIHGYNGVVVNAITPEAFAEGIYTILANQDTRHKLGKNGIALAANYGWERQTDSLEAFYRSILELNH